MACHPQRSGNARWPPLGCDPAGLFLSPSTWPTMNRATFLVDGFNLYHSISDAARFKPGEHLKWLDRRSLCTSYLPLLGKNARLEAIYYFSALATHRQTTDPTVIQRHERLLDCFRGCGIHVELGRFKAKPVSCPSCKTIWRRHEEKETDVAIAVRLLDLFYNDECDTAVLMTGDTDIAPAIRTARQRFPQKAIVCAFPFARKNKELGALATRSFRISADSYVRHQLPNPFLHPDGRRIDRPATW